jgi:hypothetical protein
MRSHVIEVIFISGRVPIVFEQFLLLTFVFFLAFSSVATIDFEAGYLLCLSWLPFSVFLPMKSSAIPILPINPLVGVH